MMAKKIHILILYFCLFSRLIFVAQPAGYSYGKLITVNYTKVTAAQTNFPVLINISSDANLRSTANGGHVQNVNGYDIVFVASDCSTILKHQLEKYDPVTGNLIAWVNTPSLSSTANTSIGMYYGNSSVSTNPSTTTVWDANYLAVWHFNSSLSDGTSNSRNLTDNSTANFPSSKIGDGRDLDNNTNIASSAAGKFLQAPNNLFAGVTNFTFEGWVYLDRDDTSWERVFDFGQGATVNFFFTLSDNAGSPANTRARITTSGGGGEQGPSVTNATANTGSWNYWNVVKDNTANTLAVYKNGALYGSQGSVTLNPSNMEASITNYFGKSQYGVDNYIDAKYDEFRISSKVRSASWIATSYNNQNAPSTFYSVGSEMTAASLCAVLPVELIEFTGTCYNHMTHLAWTTLTEHNSDQFIVERSQDGVNWLVIQSIQGAGNNQSRQDYSCVDKSACGPSGFNYYRLRQLDYDHSVMDYKSIAVECCTDKSLIDIYPNPSDGQFTITDAGSSIQLNVYDILGRSIYEDSGNITQAAITDIMPGTYLIVIRAVSGEVLYNKTWVVAK